MPFQTPTTGRAASPTRSRLRPPTCPRAPGRRPSGPKFPGSSIHGEHIVRSGNRLRERVVFSVVHTRTASRCAAATNRRQLSATPTTEALPPPPRPPARQHPAHRTPRRNRARISHPDSDPDMTEQVLSRTGCTTGTSFMPRTGFMPHPGSTTNLAQSPPPSPRRFRASWQRTRMDGGRPDARVEAAARSLIRPDPFGSGPLPDPARSKRKTLDLAGREVVDGSIVTSTSGGLFGPFDVGVVLARDVTGEEVECVC